MERFFLRGLAGLEDDFPVVFPIAIAVKILFERDSFPEYVQKEDAVAETEETQAERCEAVFFLVFLRSNET